MDALIYTLLILTSVVGLAFIIERGLALRWGKVVPPSVTAALAECRTRDDVATLRAACEQKPSSLGRLLTLAANHLDWSKTDNVEAFADRRAARDRPSGTRAGRVGNHRGHRAAAWLGRNDRRHDSPCSATSARPA